MWLAIVLWPAVGRADIDWPAADPGAPITVRADRAARWRQGNYDVWHLQGNCQIQQDRVLARGHEAVLWVDIAPPGDARPAKLIAYLEGDVWVDHNHQGSSHAATGRAAQSMAGRTWLGRFETRARILMQVPLAEAPTAQPAVYQRGTAARQRELQPVQFTEEIPTPAAENATTVGLGNRRVIVRGRSNVRPQAQLETDPVTNETIVIFKAGILAAIEGIQPADLGELGPSAGDLSRVTIETDRLVLWAPNLQELGQRGEATQPGDIPLELYMEGNIVFRQGERVIYAERMYYNVGQDYGVVLAAEMLTPVPEYEGLLRLKADVLQVVDRYHIQAYGAAATSSRMGVPSYWFQSENLSFQDQPRPATDPLTGQPVFEPGTGQQQLEHNYLATARNNFIYVSGVPVFYWPTIATDLSQPSYFLEQIKLGNDNVFGTQIMADWNAYQLLGIRRPIEGTRWTLSTDYLSDRGFGLGTNFTYERDQFLGIPSPTRGFIDAWGIKDDGLDNLGQQRQGLVPEETYRYRVLSQHRQFLPYGWQYFGELGLVSDRNFLEQYYELEWDTGKDATTGLELKRYFGNQSFSLSWDTRYNDFFTQTEWLPRVDHFLTGQPLLFDRLTWFAHSQVSYAHQRPATQPEDPQQAALWQLFPWETDSEGIRAATRQEIDLPLSLGPVKVVPYALGEAAHWGGDIDDEDLTRLYGQAGIRASLPLWRVDPTVQSALLNVNGLAHKIVFETDIFYADANRDVAQLPMYDPFDDDAVEESRRVFSFTTFGGVIPDQFDPRYFAVRSGLQRWVNSPSLELADDLTLARLGVRQRWQTKRGLPGQERIIDWILLDVQGSVYPDADRDNFGQEFGQLDYDFRWHVGDRFTLLSDGYFDFFADGLRSISIGGLLSRPERGQLYLGYRSLEGPISSNIVNARLSYRLSEKWIANLGTSYDFGEAGNIGQSVSIVRVGESALVRLGFIVDTGRDNVGLQLAIEPRFLPRGRLGQVGGVQIPPAGARGLE